MDTHEDEPLTLLNIANGAAAGLFNEELRKVLTNIQDVNTEAKPSRTITLKFTFEPSASRNESAVTVEATSKLAAFSGMQGMIFVGTFRGEPVATPYRPDQQQKLFDEQSRPRGVGAGGVVNIAAAQ